MSSLSWLVVTVIKSTGVKEALVKSRRCRPLNLMFRSRSTNSDRKIMSILDSTPSKRLGMFGLFTSVLSELITLVNASSRSSESCMVPKCKFDLPILVYSFKESLVPRACVLNAVHFASSLLGTMSANIQCSSVCMWPLRTHLAALCCQSSMTISLVTRTTRPS